jgi:hypothetical protein
MKQFKRGLLKGITLLAIVFIATVGIVYANTPVRTPAGFDKTVVFMAAGLYNSSVPPAEGDLAIWYHKIVMGRTDPQIAEVKNKAKQYFKDEFGIDTDPVAFGVDPRNEYRAYYISGMDISDGGWVVRDGGFNAVFTAPTTLHGKYGGTAGKTVPAGSMIVYGDYNIDVTGPGNSGKNPSDVKPLIIHYQSAEPIIPDMINNGITFRCTVIAPWGEGIAQGISYPQDLGKGIVQANIRAVQTYPKFGPSIVHLT